MVGLWLDKSSIKKKKTKTIQTYLDDERRLSQKKGILYVRNHLPKSNQKELKLLQAKYKLIPEVVKNLKKSLKNWKIKERWIIERNKESATCEWSKSFLGY